ncbi:uncharacterized protein LOC111374237 [Olea europaea var. sylvestris]|uniref:uncharacterized protein LOC111374237 n=1 Tax=Olea europaea var. sylvestris TaxID=158386 RepID=UPI000C1D693B|nr:uncharacterized protein LOC111374237 [Olea europaea var. sylvestris]
MRTLSPKLQLIIPGRVDNEWAEMLLNCSWKPLDLNAAIRMLEDKSNARNTKDGSSECEGDSPEKNKLGNNCQDSTQESQDLETIKWMNRDEYQARKRSFFYKNWPSTDDSECEWLLARIHATFELLIKHNYLASSHLSKVIYFAVEQLQGLADDSHLLNYNMDQTPLCICFLSAPNLEKIMTFLGEILRDIFSFPPGKYSDKRYSTDDSISCTQVVDTTEKKTFALNDLVLVLDELFPPCKLNSSLYDDSSSATSLCNYYKNNDVVLDSDALLSWIYTGPSSGELLASWTCAMEERVQQCKEILELHEKEFYNLQGLCEIKCEGLNYEEALQAVNDLCCKERIKREHDVPQGYDRVLMKRLEELVGRENGITVISSRFELDIIENILKDAESAKNDHTRTKDHLHQVDSCIEGAIQRRQEQASIELSKVDARILRVVSLMQQLEIKLDSASAHDFRSMFTHLVKSYLRTHLEGLAEKDATKKSDAAGEALLAELALDSEQGFGGGCNKRKNKKSRRNKESKATGGNRLQMIRDQRSEMISHIRVHDWDDPDAEVSFAGTDVASRHQKEEYKHRIKLKFDERKLEENLKYERQIENEAKEKHLAEQPVSSEKNNVEVGQLRSKDNPNGDGALPLKKLSEMDDLECSSIKVMDDVAHVMDIYLPGLTNKNDEYNSFLNVIIQALWHLRRFRDELLRTSTGHIHAGDPRVTCALYDIFTSLNTASTDTQRESVAPRSLRVALSNRSHDSKFFQEGQMNDASEVLGVIFDCLHQSFPCIAPPVQRFGSLDYKKLSCISHSLFGMEIFERINCDSCGLESRHQKYDSFFHNINARDLRTMKVKCPGNSFDELLNLVGMSQQLACDPEVGGCGKLNYVHRVLSAKPYAFVSVLAWQNTSESSDDITATLAALTTEIDISVLYRGIEQKSKHCLVSLVCFLSYTYCWENDLPKIAQRSNKVGKGKNQLYK